MEWNGDELKWKRKKRNKGFHARPNNAQLQTGAPGWTEAEK